LQCLRRRIVAPLTLRLADKLQRHYTVDVSELRFEWDDAKHAANIRKHRVSFEEAEGVFADEHALLIDDPDHSDDEDRFILLGISAHLRMLVVCHCYRSNDDVIRIISARTANRRERKRYVDQR
jgi:uncharacterized DUF497 family protein